MFVALVEAGVEAKEGGDAVDDAAEVVELLVGEGAAGAAFGVSEAEAGAGPVRPLGEGETEALFQEAIHADSAALGGSPGLGEEWCGQIQFELHSWNFTAARGPGRLPQADVKAARFARTSAARDGGRFILGAGRG